MPNLKKTFDTLFLLNAHKYVSQADSSIPLTKVEKKRRQHAESRANLEFQKARMKRLRVTKTELVPTVAQEVPILEQQAEEIVEQDIEIHQARQEVVEQMDIDIHPPPVYRIEEPELCAKDDTCIGGRVLHLMERLQLLIGMAKKTLAYTSSRQLTIFKVTYPYPRSEYLRRPADSCCAERYQSTYAE